MNVLLSWWDSLELVSRTSTALLITTAVIAVLSVIVTLRHNKLTDRAQAAERARLNAETARLNSEVKTANARAEEANAKLQPRSLSSEQAGILTAALRTFLSEKPILPVVVSSHMNDAESIGYGRQLFAAIEKSGWEVRYNTVSQHTFPGIAIFLNPPVPSEQCDAVRNAFTKAGVSFDTGYLDVKGTVPQLDNTIYVIVGNK